MSNIFHKNLSEITNELNLIKDTNAKSKWLIAQFDNNEIDICVKIASDAPLQNSLIYFNCYRIYFLYFAFNKNNEINTCLINWTGTKALQEDKNKYLKYKCDIYNFFQASENLNISNKSEMKHLLLKHQTSKTQTKPEIKKETVKHKSGLFENNSKQSNVTNQNNFKMRDAVKKNTKINIKKEKLTEKISSDSSFNDFEKKKVNYKDKFKTMLGKFKHETDKLSNIEKRQGNTNVKNSVTIWGKFQNTSNQNENQYQINNWKSNTQKNEIVKDKNNTFNSPILKKNRFLFNDRNANIKENQINDLPILNKTVNKSKSIEKLEYNQSSDNSFDDFEEKKTKNKFKQILGRLKNATEKSDYSEKRKSNIAVKNKNTTTKNQLNNYTFNKSNYNNMEKIDNIQDARSSEIYENDNYNKIKIEESPKTQESYSFNTTNNQTVTNQMLKMAEYNKSSDYSFDDFEEKKKKPVIKFKQIFDRFKNEKSDYRAKQKSNINVKSLISKWGQNQIDNCKISNMNTNKKNKVDYMKTEISSPMWRNENDSYNLQFKNNDIENLSALQIVQTNDENTKNIEIFQNYDHCIQSDSQNIEKKENYTQLKCQSNISNEIFGFNNQTEFNTQETDQINVTEEMSSILNDKVFEVNQFNSQNSNPSENDNENYANYGTNQDIDYQQNQIYLSESDNFTSFQGNSNDNVDNRQMYLECDQKLNLSNQIDQKDENINGSITSIVKPEEFNQNRGLRALVMYEFINRSDDEIYMRCHSIISNITYVNEDWCKGINEDKQYGDFPTTYVKFLKN